MISFNQYQRVRVDYKSGRKYFFDKVIDVFEFRGYLVIIRPNQRCHYEHLIELKKISSWEILHVYSGD